jgi:hypothetical protein
MSDPKNGARAALLIDEMKAFAGDPAFFRLAEERGIHVTPVHPHQPIPDTRDLPPELWSPKPAAGVDLRPQQQLALLGDLARYAPELESLPLDAPAEESGFYLANPTFGGTDALVLYAMLRHTPPRQVVEVGSGPSTWIAKQALERNGAGRMLCVDPNPGPIVRATGVDVIPTRVERVGYDLFTSLGAGDVILIDSSHVVKCGSDVNFLILEVLPRLKAGVRVQFHDIFLPEEMPREWVMTHRLFWSEQYLLQAFLAFNSHFRVLLANAFLGTQHNDAFVRAFPRSNWWGGGSFWIERAGLKDIG